MNKHLALISGGSTTGKSACFRHIKEPEKVMYLNCEAGKELPFPEGSKFKNFTITDPYQIYDAFTHAKEKGLGSYHTIIIDSLTFLMDMYESVHVTNSTNGMKAWADYGQFFKNLMQSYVANSEQNVFMTAHTLATLNEKEMAMETKVPVKGALKNNGIEAYFGTVISTKVKPLKDLEPYHSDFLNISEDDEILGFKHVFQTRLTKETVGERIRSPMGLFSAKETYIDNDINHIIKRMHEYFK